MIIGALVLPPGIVGMTEASIDAQAGNRTNAKLRVDDGERVRAHLARPDGVEDRVRVAADGVAHLRVVPCARDDAERLAAGVVEARVGGDLLGELHAVDEDVEVLGRGEVLRIDGRRVGAGFDSGA